MKTPGTLTALSRASVRFYIIVVLLVRRSSGLVCYTTVESLDLGCLLRWDCPHASPNTTYTVQTKTQGDPWQDVSWCVWVSSHSCDISQTFSNFELYNMIRLGVHLDPSSTVWIEPRKFDYSDFNYSPPSVTVSLKEEQLLVKVQFPCAANRRCSMARCCPITQLIDPWTTVTVYNSLNQSQYQSRTVWTQEAVSYVEFSGLAPGQNYCAVANFSFPTFSLAASPKSAPQCVVTLSKSGLVPLLCLAFGLTSLLLVPLLTMFLRKPKQDEPAIEIQAKTQASVHDSVTLVPFALEPVDHCDIHVEFTEDQISTDSSSSLQSDQDQILTVQNGNEPMLGGFSPGASYCDSGGMELEQGLDSGIGVSHPSDETCGVNGY
ncbi:uncharacterized protein si:dkeyp-75h12.7 [Xyrichtys novacula]|uniref:Uncharacterized protein si:dkeyp-75h12.7 n=1 Tax=Xyrichtys novacula TaxID=13765 RepID=A0AAV1HJ85_XYRNO|nr:uncharacterized protein si:dkeyp-75h12.7 [Xyrichtys novacula]